MSTAELLKGPLPPHQNIGPAISGITWASLSLAIITVALRLYSRISSKQLGFDDLFIFLALCLAIFGDAAAQLQVNNGFGQQ